MLLMDNNLLLLIPLIFESYSSVFPYSFKVSLYEKWNNIPHYSQTEINGRGPCEPFTRTTPSFPQNRVLLDLDNNNNNNNTSNSFNHRYQSYR